MASLSIVIPVLNEERYIGDLLSDIAFQTRTPDQVLVVDAGSTDGTVGVIRRFPFAKLLRSTPPVAHGRNLGGRSASGDILIFLDADARLPETFLEGFLSDFERRGLEVACPLYFPYGSTRVIEGFHVLFNLFTKTFEDLLPSGAGTCIAVRGDVFRNSDGFDPALKFDDIELIRRLSKDHRFGIVRKRIFLSDRRYTRYGVTRTMLQYSLMALFFALGKFSWANYIDYEFGAHGQ